MGYQESLRPIKHLAESAGIKKAIDDYADNPHIPEYCHYYCSTRARGGGQLYACIGGQRCRVHIVAGIDWDWAIPPDAKYSDYYEDLDESLVEAAAKERPDLAEKAYQEVAAAFKRAELEGIEWERKLREEANELWPTVAKTILECGPSPIRLMEAQPVFDGHFAWNILVDLERQGRLKFEGASYKDRTLCLTDKALDELGLEELPEPLTPYERLPGLLEQYGPLSTKELSRSLGIGVDGTRRLLHGYLDQGSVIAVGKGRSRKYRCVDTGVAAAAGEAGIDKVAVSAGW